MSIIFFLTRNVTMFLKAEEIYKSKRRNKCQEKRT